MKLKVYPANYIEQLEEKMKDDTVAVGIEEMSITYILPADTNSAEEQFLTIKTSYTCSVPVDANIEKEGYYYDISIPEGQHWSVNSGEELKALVDDFEQRLYGITKKKK